MGEIGYVFVSVVMGWTRQPLGTETEGGLVRAEQDCLTERRQTHDPGRVVPNAVVGSLIGIGGALAAEQTAGCANAAAGVSRVLVRI